MKSSYTLSISLNKTNISANEEARWEIKVPIETRRHGIDDFSLFKNICRERKFYKKKGEKKEKKEKERGKKREKKKENIYNICVHE